MQIRVAIFEGNPIMLDAYKAILNGVDGFVCSGAFTNCGNLKHDIEKLAHRPLLERPDATIERLAAWRKQLRGAGRLVLEGEIQWPANSSSRSQLGCSP